MKRIFNTLFFLSFFVFNTATAQQDQWVFGSVTPADFEKGATEVDPDAEAVVIFDKGVIRFDYKGDGLFEVAFIREKRIKILKNSGVRFAEISIPFYSESHTKRERVSNIKAFSYNLSEGKVLKKGIDKKNIFEEQKNEYWGIQKLAIPDVKEGSVIEISYRIDSPFKFNLPEWHFQDVIPTLHSELTVYITPFYQYSFIAQEIEKFDEYYSREAGPTHDLYNAKYREVENKFVLKNVPAFKDEDFVTSTEDYIKKINFQLNKTSDLKGITKNHMTTWPKLVEAFHNSEYFGKYLKKCERVAKKIVENDFQLTNLNELEKAKVIIDYAKQNFIWNDRSSVYATNSLSEFLESRKGNSAQINLFLTALLNAADIKATPVILSTRDHGKIKYNYPYEHFFNTVVVLVEVGTNYFLTDATDDLLSFDRLPIRCINDRGLLIDKNEENWVVFNTKFPSEKKFTLFTKLNTESTTLETTVMMQTTEYESYLLKQAYKDDPQLLKSYIENKLEVINPQKINSRYFDKNNLPYIVFFEMAQSPEIVENYISFNPFAGFQPEENWFKQDSRVHPVDMIFPQSIKFETRIEIPQQYSIESVPQDFQFEDEDIFLELNYKPSDGYILAHLNFTFKSDVYPKSDYAKLKSEFQKLVDRCNETLVLKKL